MANEFISSNTEHTVDELALQTSIQIFRARLASVLKGDERRSTYETIRERCVIKLKQCVVLQVYL